jgi:hypothetical protein
MQIRRPIPTEAVIDAWLQTMQEDAEEIYVRDQKDGVWGNYPLSELPFLQAVGWLRLWIKEKRAP